MVSSPGGPSQPLIPHRDEGRLHKSMGRATPTPRLGGPVPFCGEELWSGPVFIEEPGWAQNLEAEGEGTRGRDVMGADSESPASLRPGLVATRKG